MQQQQQAEGISASREVMIVDDERDIVEVLADLLRDEGYTPVVFLDGAAALAYLSERLPALVITDLRLPAMSGQEFVARLRAQCGPALPVVVMSAAVTAEAVDELPVQAVLKKPFELDDFATLIHRWAPQR